MANLDRRERAPAPRSEFRGYLNVFMIAAALVAVWAYMA